MNHWFKYELNITVMLLKGEEAKLAEAKEAVWDILSDSEFYFDPSRPEKSDVFKKPPLWTFVVSFCLKNAEDREETAHLCRGVCQKLVKALEEMFFNREDSAIYAHIDGRWPDSIRDFEVSVGTGDRTLKNSVQEKENLMTEEQKEGLVIEEQKDPLKERKRQILDLLREGIHREVDALPEDWFCYDNAKYNPADVVRELVTAFEYCAGNLPGGGTDISQDAQGDGLLSGQLRRPSACVPNPLGELINDPAMIAKAREREKTL
jgi:hypothetical protein